MPGLLADEDYDCAAVATCAGGPTTTFAVRTGPAFPRTPVIEVEHLDPAEGREYVLLNRASDCYDDVEPQELLVVDREGRVRWWYTPPDIAGMSVEFRYHGDGRFEWGGGWEPNPLGRPRQVDLYDGEIYDSAVALPDVDGALFHHDGKQLADGRLLTLEEVPIDDGAGGSFDGFRVRRVDPATGAVDFEYHSQRAFDEGHLPRRDGDAWHANWVDIVDVGGREQLNVSLCFVGKVAAIDVATGEWLWTLGAGGDFTLVDPQGNPLPDSEYTQCQHGLDRAGDRLLAYDNGWFRGYTRVAEYALDEATLTATLLWTWTEPDWYESILGDADWLPDGRVLVDMGHSECQSSSPGDRTTVVELDPARGTKLWEMRYAELTATAYRADWADPCALFANAKYCPAVGARLAELGL
jgi:outer membrane protein assembly factor BamB